MRVGVAEGGRKDGAGCEPFCANRGAGIGAGGAAGRQQEKKGEDAKRAGRRSCDHVLPRRAGERRATMPGSSSGAISPARSASRRLAAGEVWKP